MTKRQTEYVSPIAGADAAAHCLRECFSVVTMLHHGLTGGGMMQGRLANDTELGRMVRECAHNINAAYAMFVGPADKP